MARIEPREVKWETAPAPPPAKGMMTVKVGEEQQRFVVPTEYLGHPRFLQLLDEAAAVYGFHRTGVITFPCTVDHFRHICDHIERDLAAGHGRHRRRRHHPHFTLPITK